MAFHAQRECAQATEHQMRIKRAEHCAEQVGVGAYLIEQRILCANDCSGSAVSMSANVFCRAMDDQIDSMLDRSEQARRGEGTINNGDCVNFLCHRADSIDVYHLNKRIGDGFHINNIWLFLANALNGGWAAKIGQNHLNASRHKEFLE